MDKLKGRNIFIQKLEFKLVFAARDLEKSTMNVRVNSEKKSLMK